MTDRPNSVTTPGGAIGARITRLVADAIVHTRAETAPTLARIGMQIFTDSTNHVSDELRGVWGAIFRGVAAHPDASPELKGLFTALGTQRGQAWALVGGTATGAAMGGGLMNLLTNELNPVVLPIIANNPHGVLGPGDAARAEMIGLDAPPLWSLEAAKSGIDGNRFKALVELGRPHPTPDELAAMVSRGGVSLDRAVAIMRRSGYTHDEAVLILGLRAYVPSPQELAAMWARNLVSDADGAALAAKSGADAHDWAGLKGLAGEPPDLTSIIMAWRRGIITEAQVDRAITQGPIRNEWIPAVKALQHEPLSPVDAASAVTQGHLTEQQGARVAALSGISADDFRLIVENAGLPPGLEFAAEAVNRGLISDSEWERMFLESRIKNRYIPLMRAMRTNLIPAETARMMYRLGVYPAEALATNLTGHGFTRTDADAMVALEDVRKTEGAKDLSTAQVIELFTDELITRETAAGMLSAVGYDDQETEWRLQLAEVDKMRRYVNAVVGRVRAGYVKSRIPVNEAIGLLDQAGVSPMQRDNLIDLWDLERDTVSASLTTAQIQAALRKGLIEPVDAYERFLGNGYGPADARILVVLAGGELPAGSGE